MPRRISDGSRQRCVEARFRINELRQAARDRQQGWKERAVREAVLLAGPGPRVPCRSQGWADVAMQPQVRFESLTTEEESKRQQLINFVFRQAGTLLRIPR